MENKKKSKNPPMSSKVEEIVKIWNPRSRSAHTDILGSYTGTGEFGEQPIQDADDL